ncbi:cysteine desulfurase family protein [Botrimarina hoheduenensis]|uniref:cysteine desulfurase n=1 Tax=Botrimarina hoheduenensis TaxID=2528000 RepID=A0A5C5WAU3_9BACT|nr:cysteine desulfurase family protein [Botrimarina hoheduenensis]TWT47637.1 Cysteine desulfurase [Botrimarina hoheduenensis]
MRWIYLDYNATTPLAPAAQEAMLPYLADRYADPRAEHAPGRIVAEAIDDARTRVATALGAFADEVAWTSSGTESCSRALRETIEPALRAGSTPHLVVSAIDHAAVLGTARFLQTLGAGLTVVRVDAEGRVDPSDVMAALRPETRLVSIGLANEEIGTVQPLAAIAELCHDEGVLVHTDATQAFGKLPIDVRSLGVDLLSVSAHKAYGPKGVGVLYARRGAPVEPCLLAGFEAADEPAGMPNIAGIVGFGAAAPVAADAAQHSRQQLAALRDRLAKLLLSGAGGGQVYGQIEGPRLVNTLCIALPGVTASDLLSATPEIAATPCATGGPETVVLSPTLQAINADPRVASGAIRLSLGWQTTADEVERAAAALLDAWERCRD